MESPLVRRALISVSDKQGLAEFVQSLVASGVEIYSTGGTRAYLETHGIRVQDVAQYTGFPEMMDGRLKTLHPKIFGGLLCRYDLAGDLAALEQHGIVTFELAVVNLYPFAATIARTGVTRAEAVEKIDIGGPSLVRAAAKNHAFTTIAVSADQYGEIATQIASHGKTSPELRRKLAAAAFAHTAAYDRTIADYFAREQAAGEHFPGVVTLELHKRQELRYGENSHQKGAVYAELGAAEHSLVNAKQLHGKELSYNNLLDIDSALAVVRGCELPAAAVIKHNNPCGAAIGETLVEAARKALDGDPQSAFGGILAFNREVDEATAELLATPGLFLEAIAAPEFSAAALGILTSKPKWKANVRLMQVGLPPLAAASTAYRQIDGGMLVQDADYLPDPEVDWKTVTERAPNATLLEELRFAWWVVRHVKSNAIAICADTMLLGAGAGQMSRVDSVEIAIRKAGDRVSGAVLASDAFFPFPDSIERAAKAGISAIIQPGGSVKDPDVIAACDRLGIAMVFTNRRHFKH